MMNERTEKITALRNLPRHLREAVKGLQETQLDTPYRQGGWTVRQVVHHIADSHMHACLRMKFIVTEDHPVIKPYDQDCWAALPDAAHGPLEPSLQILDGLHDRWVRFLESLPDAAWTRSALHPERGEVTLESMLRTYAGHGEKHVAQIIGLKTARGW
jgi:uncharacterized damage-inducible protein DinB